MTEGLTEPWPRRRSLGYFVGAALLLFTFTQSAAAQEESTTRGATVYRYAAIGETVMNIDLWGLVLEPGRYQVAPTTTLVDLITLAGGPDFQVEDTKTIRETTVEIAREGSSGLAVVFTAQLEEITNGTAAPPQLLDGDIVTVQALVRQRFSWLEALSVVGSVAAVTYLIIRIATGA
jgi:hypothetical protein